MPPPIVSVPFGLTYALTRIVSLHPPWRAAKFEESMMLHWALSVATEELPSRSSSPGSASPEQGLISGSYILDEERSDDVQRALETRCRRHVALHHPPFLRSQAAQAAGAPYAIGIPLAAGRFSIKFDAKPVIVAWTSGEPIQWTLKGGQVFDVSARANGEAISLTSPCARQRADNSVSQRRAAVGRTEDEPSSVRCSLHQFAIGSSIIERADRVYRIGLSGGKPFNGLRLVVADLGPDDLFQRLL